MSKEDYLGYANGQVERCYEAIVLGQPKQAEGRVETNIGRDVRDRKRMGVFPWQGSRWAHAWPCNPSQAAMGVHIVPRSKGLTHVRSAAHL